MFVSQYLYLTDTSGVLGIADASIESGFTSATSTLTTANNSHDFVWAVRVSKITKGLFDKKWSQKTYSKGAVFDMKEKKADIEAILADERVTKSEVFTIESSKDSVEYLVVTDSLEVN